MNLHPRLSRGGIGYDVEGDDVASAPKSCLYHGVRPCSLSAGNTAYLLVLSCGDLGLKGVVRVVVLEWFEWCVGEKFMMNGGRCFCFLVS